MNLLIVLPILIPLFTAILSLLAWKSRGLQRIFGVSGASALLAAALLLFSSVWRNGIQATQIGNWPAPFGITIVADLLSASMVALTALMGLAVVLYSLAAIDAQREAFGYHALLQILIMGVCGAFLTGDIFNLYVWFEVLLIASFVLMQLGSEKAQLEGAIKYVTLNLISSALFLTAIAILYGMVGTLNLADLAVQLGTVSRQGMLTTLAVLFLLAFGIKAAIFPLFFWLPASYHTPPAPISAIFAGLLTKVGVYSMIRVFTLLFIHDVGTTHNLILIAAGLTMITGILGALVQNDFRRILSFNLVSHVGYMIMGLGLFSPLALAGSIFYTAQDIIVKTGLFLVSGVVYRLRGTYRLSILGGLYTGQPLLAILFLLPALSLAGIPPFAGFWGKLILIKAGLSANEYLIVAVALTVGLLTLYSMSTIWSEVFWKEAPEETDGSAVVPLPYGAWLLYMAPVAGLALLTVLIGLWPGPVFNFARQAAEQLVDPSGYIQVVLEGPA